MKYDLIFQTIHTYTHSLLNWPKFVSSHFQPILQKNSHIANVFQEGVVFWEKFCFQSLVILKLAGEDWAIYFGLFIYFCLESFSPEIRRARKQSERTSYLKLSLKKM